MAAAGVTGWDDPAVDGGLPLDPDRARQIVTGSPDPIFVVTLDGRLALAPLPADAPHNAYAHPILADGAAVRTAGGITVVHDDGQVRAVSLDAASRAYCTATESLRPAIRALRALGVPSERITVEGGVFACVVPSGPPKRYGPIMVAVARRHEMLGRALAAGRWDLAGYAVEELGEDIEELPLALPPHDARVDPLPIARGFYEGPLRALTAAVATRDARVAREAWQATSRGCNGCHQAVGKGFIVVPETPGDAVPVITADDAGVPAD